MGEYIGLVPPPEGFVQTGRYNFGRYSRGENYRKVNRDLTDKVFELLPEQNLTAVDVAMGDGMVPRLATERLSGTNRRLYMVGVDSDAYAVETAKTQIPDTPNVHFTFLQGDARVLPEVLAGYVEVGQVDYTSIHDAIHEIRDDEAKAAILKNQARILRPGGLFSYNSAFTTEAVGREWAFLQMAFMELFGAYKYRGKDVQKLPVHPPSFYRGLIIEAGLIPIHEAIVKVPHYQEELEAISEYPSFVNGFTQMMVFERPVYLEEAVDGIKRAIRPVFDKFKTNSIVRTWHEIIAQKLV